MTVHEYMQAIRADIAEQERAAATFKAKIEAINADIDHSAAWKQSAAQKAREDFTNDSNGRRDAIINTLNGAKNAEITKIDLKDTKLCNAVNLISSLGATMDRETLADILGNYRGNMAAIGVLQKAATAGHVEAGAMTAFDGMTYDPETIYPDAVQRVYNAFKQPERVSLLGLPEIYELDSATGEPETRPASIQPQAVPVIF